MLKRAWLVLCILWSLFWGAALLSTSDPPILGLSILLAAPWLLWLLLFYAGRFIFRGRFTRW